MEIIEYNGKTIHLYGIDPSEEKRIENALNSEEYIYEEGVYLILSDDYFYCDECMEVHPYTYSEYHFVDDKTLCEKCFDKNYYYCERCGEVVPIGEGKSVIIDSVTEQWCDDCVEDNTFTCANCGDLHADYDGEYVYNGCDSFKVCSFCAENDYHYCNDCSRYVISEMWDNRDCCCIQCKMDTYIREYHDNPEVRFDGVYSHKQYTIGTEIETDGEDTDIEERVSITNRYGKDENYIYQMHDGSLSSEGIECITQPMTYNFWESFDFEGWFQELVDAGARAHDTTTCGLHVHLSKDWFGDDEESQQTTVGVVINLIDYWQRKIEKLSRRESNQWCLYPSSDGFSGNKKDALDEAFNAKSYDDYKTCIKDAGKRGDKGHSSRYDCVNTNSSAPTYEFRMFRGTLNPETYRGSVELCIRLVEYAKYKIKNEEMNYTWLEFTSFSPMKESLERLIEKFLK